MGEEHNWELTYEALFGRWGRGGINEHRVGGKMKDDATAVF